ncbi:hypothetical protein PAXINDRAFT_68657 [Paxillus involutus ATCC 200175]|nr:hypothetical protein PAXINDRAFT_68657 [Paxillus involutus ATCC 200175]
MTVLFSNLRFIAYLSVFLLSGAVLGLVGHLASLFLPTINHDFTIFSLVVPSATIFVFIILIQFAQPMIEVTLLFMLGVLWLGMGAWSADIIGYVQCYVLGGVEQQTNNGTMSARTYCYQMKVIEALSWCIFVMFAFFFVIEIALTTRAVVLGRAYAWREHTSQLGWFGEWPAYPGEAIYPRGPAYAHGPYQPYAGNYVQQAPGHSIVIQPGMHGGPAMVTQVPG